MLYLNRFYDNEENKTNYERFIITDKDCTSLINECIDVYNKLFAYDNVEQFLQNNILISNDIEQFLLKHKDWQQTDFENAYVFTINILINQQKIKLIDYVDKEFYY